MSNCGGCGVLWKAKANCGKAKIYVSEVTKRQSDLQL